MEVYILPYLPTVITKSVTNYSLINDVYQAECGGQVTDDGGGTISARGVCWGLSHNPDLTGDHTIDSVGSEEFTSIMSGLNAHKTYYVRAYATNENGISFGNEISFTTPAGLPSVTTNSVSNITHNSATCGGNVTLDNGFPVLERGVCWSTVSSPSINGDHTSDGSGLGEFTSELTNLNENSTYYVRAYARNSNGISYGSIKLFNTKKALPTVTTSEATSITTCSAITGGTVTDEGSAPVTERGVCWSKTVNHPTIGDNHTTDGTGAGVFQSYLLGLQPNSRYYVRAYATNSFGTVYGSTTQFITMTDLPIVITGTASNITHNSVRIVNNTITDVGTSSVIARGVCWKVGDTPTIDDEHTTNGGGGGSYDSSVTGLSPATTYRIRAYATNGSGTSYGQIITVTTQ